MRFLHTSDWQIGMDFKGLAGKSQDEAIRLKSIRHNQMIRSIFECAKKLDIDRIFSAGDQFEYPHIPDKTINEFLGVVGDYRDIHLYLIPGNHDPYDDTSIYKREIFQKIPSNLHIIKENQKLDYDGGEIYFTVLKEKYGSYNPLDWIEPMDKGKVRVGVGHGSLKIVGKYSEDDFPIDTDTAEKKHLDYLALGHWHSYLSFGDGKTFYSGTPEPTKHGEKEAGHVLEVEIDKHSSSPRVVKHEIKSYTWIDRSAHVYSKKDIDLLLSDYDSSYNESHVLKLHLTGQLSLDDHTYLEQKIEKVMNIVSFIDVNKDHVEVDLSDADREKSIPDDYLKKVYHRLKSIHDGMEESPSSLGEGVDSGDCALKALQIMIRAFGK